MKNLKLAALLLFCGLFAASCSQVFASGVGYIDYQKVQAAYPLAQQAVKEVDGVMFICADHGNAEKLIDDNGEPYTAHTTNPVPFILVNYDEAYTLKENGKLCDIIPTLIDIMELEKPAEMTGESLLIKK